MEQLYSEFQPNFYIFIFKNPRAQFNLRSKSTYYIVIAFLLFYKHIINMICMMHELQLKACQLM
jgi:hypothetical protein